MTEREKDGDGGDVRLSVHLTALCIACLSTHTSTYMSMYICQCVCVYAHCISTNIYLTTLQSDADFGICLQTFRYD